MAWCGPRRPAPGRRPARRDLPVRRRGSGRSPRSGRKLNRRRSPALRPEGRTADARRGVRGGSTHLRRPRPRWGTHRDALADALAAVGDYARRLRHAPAAPFDPEPLMTARDAAAVTPSQASTRPPSCTSPGDSPSAFGRWSRRSPTRTWAPPIRGSRAGPRAGVARRTSAAAPTGSTGTTSPHSWCAEPTEGRLFREGGPGDGGWATASCGPVRPVGCPRRS